MGVRGRRKFFFSGDRGGVDSGLKCCSQTSKFANLSNYFINESDFKRQKWSIFAKIFTKIV